jgi:ubiquinone/menaquinone biosynthesis C-methylase UbiE
MVTVARQAHPSLRFDVGSMLALHLPDGALGGIVAWYSTIHVPQERLPAVFAEFHRVLAPGGHLLLAFQVGDEVSHRTEAAGHAISLDFHRRTVSPSCSARPGWSCALGCCGSPMTMAISRRRHSRHSCWLANRPTLEPRVIEHPGTWRGERRVMSRHMLDTGPLASAR